MKRIVCLAAIGMVCLGLGAGVAGRFTRPQLPPTLQCDQNLDVGDQEHGARVCVTFVMANRGDSPLRVDDFSSSCSCAGLEQVLDGKAVPVERLTIPPRTHVELAARLVVRGIPGDSAGVRLHRYWRFPYTQASCRRSR